MMTRLALAQFGASPHTKDNLAQIALFAQQAQANQAQMLFCPEYAMNYPRSRDSYQQAAEPLDGPFVTMLSMLCRKFGLWIVCGMLEQSGDAPPFNTVVVVDAQGEPVGAYRKRKLFSAQGFQENLLLSAGDRPFSPVQTPAGKLGLLTCFELRFPALAQQQIQSGAELLCYPAAWVQGAHKTLQWHTLLAARAIENKVPVIGIGQYADPLFCGESTVYLPTGEAAAPPLCSTGLQIVKLPCEHTK